MTLKEQLMSDMKDAMRAHEMEKLSVIRFLMAEIKNFEIDNSESDEAALQKVVAGQVKKSKDAVADFKAAGRDDLVTEEEGKIAVMEAYLPAQLSDEELAKIVKETLAEMGEVKNPGQLIGAVMKKVSGRADGQRVQTMTKELNK